MASLSLGDALRAGCRPHGASADLRQGFYQILWPVIASWFAFDYVEPISAYGRDEVFDEDTGQYIRVAGDTQVYACFQGLPMGWSWSLHFANCIMEAALRVGVARSLSVRPEDVRLITEGSPGGSLQPGEVAVSSYVDNGNIIASSAELAATALRGLLDELSRRHLEFHEVQEPTDCFEAGGVTFDLRQGLARPRPARMWRLYGAMTSVLRRGGFTPAGMPPRLPPDVVAARLVCPVEAVRVLPQR